MNTVTLIFAALCVFAIGYRFYGLFYHPKAVSLDCVINNNRCFDSPGFLPGAYNAGVFTGTDWNLGKNLKLNVEGRFIDETAMSVGAAYRS